MSLSMRFKMVWNAKRRQLFCISSGLLYLCENFNKMEKETKDLEQIQLPENAFRELEAGEDYEPVMKANRVYPEVNVWSVTWGILMAVIF